MIFMMFFLVALCFLKLWTFLYTGIFVSIDGQSISHCMSMEQNVAEAVQSWEEGSPAKLMFMIRLYMPFVSGYETKDQVVNTNPRSSITLALPADSFISM